MTESTEFMLLFRFEPNASYQPTETEMAESHQAWGQFIGKLAMEERLVSTHQLGFSGKQIFADSSVHEGINIAEKLTLGGNLILKASNLDQAVELAKSCPILAMGGTVEVRDITPM
ncbi:MAG: hypothetical protein HC817_08145 [Saprospiraceae bacterium]|nr:hypothetical protein [Saprospiraceae bacterium]